MLTRIALIAGSGNFPILFAKAAGAKDVEVIAIGINEETSKDLEKYVSRMYWLGAGELEKLFQILISENLSSAVMVGKVRHNLLFDKSIKLDKSMTELLGSVKDKKTDSLIGAIAALLAHSGVKLIDSTTFLSDMLPEEGLLTDTPLADAILKDIEFGKEIAKSIAGLDIGQTVVVKDKAVLAIESIEGTDEAIKRGAYYGKDGVVIVKVSKPDQDMRFDIPI
ncbi:MAG TPA: LpxI family protein, partial [Candidatus Omnitrophica bacterium]|nr:LpxI family protein [Candidatus Omnitrophota bacterium]